MSKFEDVIELHGDRGRVLMCPATEKPEGFLLAGAFCMITTRADSAHAHHGVAVVRLPYPTEDGLPQYALHNGHLRDEDTHEVPKLIPVNQDFIDVITGFRVPEPETQCYVFDSCEHKVKLALATDFEYKADIKVDENGYVAGEDEDGVVCPDFAAFCSMQPAWYAFRPADCYPVYVMPKPGAACPKLERRATMGGGRPGAAVAAAALSVGALALAAVLM